MYIDVRWDMGTVPLKIDRRRLRGIIEPKTVKVREEAGHLHSILDSHDGQPSFPEFLAASKGKILFLVNDATRPTPTPKLLEILKEDLEGHDVDFLVATGTHRPPNEEELEQILGRTARAHWFGHVWAHDARNKDDLEYLGETSRGVPLWVNRRVLEAERLVLVNSVEPHYFAGYTGGRKSIFPGVAGFETVQANHRLALEPEAEILSLEGNPVHEDMMESIAIFREKTGNMPIFSIQMVIDRQHRIHSVHAGELEKSFEDAVEHADMHYVVDVPEAADIVIAVASYPMDYDLYQSQKAIENGSLVLKEDGILILVSKCRHGIGDETFFNLLAGQPTPQAVLDSIKGEYVLGYHKAARLAHISKKAEIWGVTSIPPEDMEAAFIRPFADVQKAVDAALFRKGPLASVVLLTDGTVTVPRVPDRDMVTAPRL
ncbi:MAG TPA: nickel-dependent lactate racemase [Thermoleophilia bacterium]|nr:nickel-dependent lactate racemase [Thermoleophilia bacterium]